jgi:AcrR family transcriptional regulator
MRAGSPGQRVARLAPSNGASGWTRLDRRKARTRRALIDAAVGLIAEGRGERASIQEITETADIGFGSFYNHFESKEQLFRTAAEEVLERWVQMIDRACAGIADPAEVFAVSLRVSGRLAWTHPDLARFLSGAGLALLNIPHGHRARCATSSSARPPAASRSRTPTSPSVPWPVACSGCCGCSRSTRNRSTRRPSTSSPKPSCACSAYPPGRPSGSRRATYPRSAPW